MILIALCAKEYSIVISVRLFGSLLVPALFVFPARSHQCNSNQFRLELAIALCLLVLLRDRVHQAIIAPCRRTRRTPGRHAYASIDILSPLAHRSKEERRRVSTPKNRGDRDGGRQRARAATGHEPMQWPKPYTSTTTSTTRAFLDTLLPIWRSTAV